MKELISLLQREIKKCSKVYETYKITYSLSKTKEVDECMIDGSLCVKIYVDVRVERNSGEVFETTCLLLNIPVKGNAGYLLNGSKVNIVDKETKSSGFSFIQGNNKDKSSIKANDWVDVTPTRNVNNPQFAWSFSIGLMPSGIMILVKKKQIPLGVFLRAVTGDSYHDLLKKFGFNHKHLISSLKDEMTRANCIAYVAKELNFNVPNLSNQLAEINNHFFSAEHLSFDRADFRRLDNTQSFRTRAAGKQLAEDVEICDVVEENGEQVCVKTLLKKGTTLTDRQAAQIDHSPLTTLTVVKGGKKFTLRKFYHPYFTCTGKTLVSGIQEFPAGHMLSVNDLIKLEEQDVENLAVYESPGRRKEYSRLVGVTEIALEHLYQAISIFIDNLDGFQLYDSEYDLKSQKILSIENESVNKVISNLGVLSRGINAQLSNTRNADVSLLTLLDTVFTGWDVNAILKSLRDYDKRTVQQFQTMNVVASAASSAKVSKNAKRSTASMVDIKDDQHCRFDPIDAPESNQIGKVNNKTYLAKEDTSGELLAPYYRVVNGVPEKEISYISALKERGAYIAQWDETFEEEVNGEIVKKKKIECRRDGTLLYTDVQNVDYMEVSPFADMSAARMQLPLQQSSLPKRLLMAGNHQKQADKPLAAQKAFVRSGGDSILQQDVVKAVDLLKYYYDNFAVRSALSREDLLERGYVQLDSMTDGDSVRTYTFRVVCEDYCDTLLVSYPFIAKAEEHTQVSYLVNTNTGLKYSGEDIVVYPDSYTLSTHNLDMKFKGGCFKAEDINFDLAVSTGVNLFVGYKTWESSSIDDALSISSRLVGDDVYTTINLHEISLEGVTLEGKTSTFLNADRLAYMEKNGLPKLGTWLRPGDRAITMSVPKIDNGIVTSTIRHAIVDPTISGQVVSTYVKDNVAYVYLADWQPIMVGDKMSGRCGNKGVVAKIVPQHLMPFDPMSGRSLDILLNPLGVPSRGNISQILETVLGMASANQNRLCVISPYYPDTTKIIEEYADLYDANPKILVDGRTGKEFYRPITVGYLYMLILHHKVTHKLNAVGTVTEKSPGTRQPVKGKKRGGGQTIGEMEFHCLMAYGANTIMQEFLTLQSEDEDSYKYYLQTLREDPFAVYEKKPSYDMKSVDNLELTNHNDQFLRCLLRSLCIEMVTDTSDNSISYVPMTSSMIRSLNNKSINVEQKGSIRQDSIFNDRNSDSRDIWSYIPLYCEVIHPIWFAKGGLSKYFVVMRKKNEQSKFAPTLLKTDDVRKIINGTFCIAYVGEDNNFAVDFESGEYVEDDYVPSDNLGIPYVFPTGLDVSAEILVQESYVGIDAIVDLFKRYPMKVLVSRFHDIILNGRFEPSESELAVYHDMLQHAQANREMTDYIIDAYPVMPLDFRFDPKTVRKKADFDAYYESICTAALKAKRSNDVSAHNDVYAALYAFFTSTGTQNVLEDKYVNLTGYYFGTKNSSDDKGHIRDGIMKRVICHSGRSTITPTSNVKMTPFEVGLPLMMVTQLWKPHLLSYMRYLFKRDGYPEIQVSSDSVDAIDWELVLDLIATKNYNRLMKVTNCSSEDFPSLRGKLYSDIYDYVEGRPCRVNSHPNTRKVVLFGRQPSLHKLSVRAYYATIVDGLSIQIHPLVCDAYNADFDGDQMWIAAMLTYNSTKEAEELLMADSTILNPKDSSLALVHAQDIRLGCYFATMLHDNIVNPSGDARYVENGQIKFTVYDDIETLRMHVETRNLHVHDLVRFNTVVGESAVSYLSTAGRILFNSLFPDGFTMNPWSNPLKLPLNPRGIYELKYDGIIAGKNRKNPVTYKLAEIMQSLYTEDADKNSIIEIYQNVMEFGFYFSDVGAVSYTLQDLKNPNKPATDKILEISKKYQKMIDEDYDSGLITDEGRKMANISLYQYATDIYRETYIDALDRNNNIFIMLDSNARGNAGQLMMVSGIIGILDKQKDETLELPILSNYKDGVSNFEMKMISYSARTGVASTQNETAVAGELTRSAVYLNSGLRIVEDDCHREEVDPKYILYTLTYGTATERVFKHVSEDVDCLLGMTNVTVQGDAMFRGMTEVDETFLTMLSLAQNDIFIQGELNGMKKDLVVFYRSDLLQHNSKVCEILAVDTIFGEILVNPELCEMLYGAVTDEELRSGKFRLNYRIAMQMQRQHIHYFDTDKGSYRFEYSLCDRDRDLLLYRFCNDDLPFMVHENFLSVKTIDFVERYGLPKVNIRTMLDCQSKDGVCAKCYGLKFDSLQLPAVGENVCIESAQAMGEPATQIKLSKFHAGGASGSGISGVDDVKFALIYGKSGKDFSEESVGQLTKNPLAVQAWRDGYIHLQPHDTISSKMLVYILSGNQYRTLQLENDLPGLKAIKNAAIERSLLVVAQGQYVREFDALTDGYKLPTEVFVGISREKFRARQLQSLDFYFNVYHENGVDVHARHFEISAVLQTGLVMVTGSSDPEFIPGGLYEYKKVVGNEEVSFTHSVQSSVKVIGHYSGPATLLSYRDISNSLSSVVTACQKDKSEGSAILGKMVVGTNLQTDSVRDNPKNNGFYVPSSVEVSNYQSSRAEDDSLRDLLQMTVAVPAAVLPEPPEIPMDAEDDLEELFTKKEPEKIDIEIERETTERKEGGKFERLNLNL